MGDLRAAPPTLITGAGCITAAGPDLPRGLAAMFAGRRSPAPPRDIETDHPVAYPVFSVPAGWFGRDGAPSCAELALVAAREALAAAGLDGPALSARRVGVCLGTVVGVTLGQEELYAAFSRGGRPPVGPIEEFYSTSLAAEVQRALGVSGPHMTVTTACSSGALAIAAAAGWLRSGLCEVAVAGGAEKVTRLSYDGFISLMIADPEPCRPFDRDRRGLNLGEGAGVLVLESAASARRRGAPVTGRLLGAGNACDAYHLARPRPDGEGLRRAVRHALAQAGAAPEEVAFINAHGTGTVENDRAEGRLLCRVFPATPFHSTKCYTGHTLGAAGGVEAALTLACLNAGRIPASAGFVAPDPEVGASPVREVSPVAGRLALSTSVAYGGNNAALLFEAGGGRG